MTPIAIPAFAPVDMPLLEELELSEDVAVAEAGATDCPVMLPPETLLAVVGEATTDVVAAKIELAAAVDESCATTVSVGAVENSSVGEVASAEADFADALVSVV